jgi:lipoprotein-anchoring transpeptidase ErfK/SrfK
MRGRAGNRRIFLCLATVLTASLGCGGCITTQISRTGPDPIYEKTEVDYVTHERAGTIVVDPANHFLYLVQPKARAIRYGVGVGADGYGWSGIATVRSKQEWPDWYPTKEYLAAHPKVIAALHALPSGQGMQGGPENPMGARAMYLWQGNKDTLVRIHGTNEPWTIGTNVSAGCFRMTNDDVSDLYGRVAVGAKVVVLPSSEASPQISAAQGLYNHGSPEAR